MSEMDDIMEEFASKNDISSAMQEKAAGEFVDEESIGDLIKDYPGVQREIDLHGKTGDETMREIMDFIHSSVTQNLRTIRVITGKGLHSPQQKSVLPELAQRKLSELKKYGLVLTFKREKNGGSFVVYLK